MGRGTDVTNVTWNDVLNGGGLAAEETPWFVRDWLAGVTADPAGSRTGPASPAGSTLANKKDNSNSQPLTVSALTFPLATTNNSASFPCTSSSSSSCLSFGASFASGPGPALHILNFLLLDTLEQEQRLPCCSTPSSTPLDSRPTTTPTTNSNPNPTQQPSLLKPLAALDTFFLGSPSASSFPPSSGIDVHTLDIDDFSSNIKPTNRTTKMPSSTLAAPDAAYFTNSTYTAANITANTSQWRPHTSRSGRSGRSPSPLFARWARRNHQHHDPQEGNDSRSSTDRKSTSSGGTSRRFGHHHHNHEFSQGQGTNGNNDNSNLTHTYNFSTSHLARSSSISKRQSQPGIPPPLTREEFEALPLAIQRKYFSTLERLRFAQASGIDDISQHYDQISAHNFKRRIARQNRAVSDNTPKPRRRSLLESHFTSADSLAFASLPEKIKKRHFTREEQAFLTRQLRTSVILDAADEAIYKVGRRASRHLNVSPEAEFLTPSISSKRNSMDSNMASRHVAGGTQAGNVPESFYDSFRWLDEEEDLDLRLFLDDYHANLRENVPSPSKQRRPSFRRHLSISKIPFGRSSISASRPATRDAVASPISPAQSPMSPGSEFHFGGHTRRKSRALSLITPKHATHDSITTIDPSAAHYQDPEARLKLRVYLASPQKFDEAIEFGFPATDAVVSNDTRAVTKRQSQQKLSDDVALRTFLADDDDDDDDEEEDKMSLNSDQPSVADPDSPQTPQAFDKPALRPLRVSTEPMQTHVSKPSEGGYAQVPVSSREMTLRMTLTRPDLRAHEEQIYGWQKTAPVAGRKSQQLSHLRDDSAATINYLAEGVPKESMEKIFAGIDHWNASNSADGNVMKRIWNRVRRA